MSRSSPWRIGLGGALVLASALPSAHGATLAGVSAGAPSAAITAEATDGSGPAVGRPDAAAGDARAPAGRPRPLDIYLGLEPRRVESRSVVEGATGRYVFEPVLQGDLVRHTLVVPNPGDEPMAITRVQTCTGCMLDGYSKTIAPGREGRVVFVVPTDALGGRTIESPVLVWTSSEATPEIRVDVTLEVREFASLTPYRVWLVGAPGEEIVARSVVVPNDAHRFRVTAVRARKGVFFTWSVDETLVDGRPGWTITLRNTRTRPGPYQDVLFIQTDHPERPELKIRVEGRIGMDVPERPDGGAEG